LSRSRSQCTRFAAVFLTFTKCCRNSRSRSSTSRLSSTALPSVFTRCGVSCSPYRWSVRVKSDVGRPPV
jgi:hypothetical protein